MSSIGKILEEIYAVIGERQQEPVNGSYTNYLLDKGTDKILQKFGEESVELLLAAKNATPLECVHEAADVLYHLSVLLYVSGVSWDEVAELLEKRRYHAQ